jgi:hypothetical protein
MEKSTKQEREIYWTEKAAAVLLNRKIVEVRYLTEEEMEILGWYNRCVVFILDDDTIVYPSKDDEGNNAGALYFQKENADDYILPVIS